MARIKPHSGYARSRDIRHLGIKDAPTIIEVGGSRPLPDMSVVKVAPTVTFDLGTMPTVDLAPTEDERLVDVDTEREALEIARKRALVLARLTGPRFRALPSSDLPGHEAEIPEITQPRKVGRQTIVPTAATTPAPKTTTKPLTPTQGPAHRKRRL